MILYGSKWPLLRHPFAESFTRKSHHSHNLEPIRSYVRAIQTNSHAIHVFDQPEDTDRKLLLIEVCDHRSMLSKFSQPHSTTSASQDDVHVRRRRLSMYMVFLPPNHPALPPAQLPRTNSSPQSALPHHSHPKSSV